MRILSSVRSRLLWLVAMAVLPAFVLIIYGAKTRLDDAAVEARNEVLNAARQLSTSSHELFDQVNMLLKVLSRTPVLQGNLRLDCNAYLSDLLAMDRRFSNLAIIGLDRKLRCSSVAAQGGIDVPDRHYFLRVIETGQFAVGRYQIDRIAGVPVLEFAGPLLDDERKLTGIVMVALNLQWLNQRIAESALPAGSSILLLDEQRTVLARYPDPERWIGKAADGFLNREGIRLRGESGTVEAVGVDRVRRLYGYVRVNGAAGGHVYLLVGSALEQAYAHERAALIASIVVLPLVSLLVFALAWHGGNVLLLRRGAPLLQATRRVAQGDLGVQIEVQGRDEIAELGASLNEMIAALRKHDAEQRDHITRIERLNRVYRVLSGINGMIVRIRDKAALLSDACKLATEQAGFVFAWIAMADRSGVIATSACSGISQAEADVLMGIRDGAQPPSHPLTGKCLSEGRYSVHDNLADYRIENLSTPEARRAASIATFPLKVKEHVLGVFGFGAETADFFDPDEIRLLQEVAADVSLGMEVIENESNAFYYAYYDRVTNLPNRTLYIDRLAQGLVRARRDRRLVTVLVVDIRDLRKITDSMGRKAGDAVLQYCGQTIAETLREGDSVARISGNGFGIAFASVPKETDAVNLVTRVIGRFPVEMPINGQAVSINACAGAAIFPNGGETAEALLQHAELAVHTASATGNAFVFYTAEADKKARERFLLERELAAALERGELHLVYQPVVDLKTRRIVAAEALLRWSNPTLGSVPPQTFIPVAEETNKIIDIGMWVLREACRQAARWHENHELPIRLTVNISGQQLQQPGLAEWFAATLDANGLRARDLNLALEVTETTLAGNLEETSELLSALRTQGLAIYIDDFGTGYSSLSYLKHLPVDVIKIDRSFVTDLADADDVALVEAVITLAHGLGLTVVAEGVETEQQLAILARLGCDAAQGYLFAKPLSSELMTAALKRGSL